MVKKGLEDILEELKSVYADIRAEALVSEITENSPAEITDFTVQNLSTFKRPYRRDILNLKNSLLSTTNYTLNLNLTRNGIYDSLPEGVFHDPSDPALKGMSYQKKRERQKNEEKEARKFFQPIENEVFNQFVTIEQEERALINRFSDIKNNFLLRFWQIDHTLPADFVMKLIKLLPYAHKISGDLELTALCLEQIIGEKVKFIKSMEPYSLYVHKGDLKDKLGVDMVLGVEESTILCPQVEVCIGPISKKNVKHFIEGTSWMRFITTFYEYFIPMEMEVKTKVEALSDENNFILNDEEPAIMGLTTAL
ncbi:hypothetical protein [Aequorivita capsosiphonis]|uniref:hypothetical protein n=1 Tax=Aequorivita capsosiphonis TaxID=487317 RepID=UPI00041A2BA2|nr:hypothetical protein [Aequorivita capsosiphonis]